MTREEAIARIQEHKIVHKMNEPRAIHISEALDMAIEALEQEPFINKPCISSGVCEHDKNEVLDEIRAEINSPNRGTCDYFIVDRIEEIIDKHKVESENKE